MFNDPFSRTTRVSQYQKGKANMDFTEARDSEWQWHQLGHVQVCTHHSVFYRPGALPAAQPTATEAPKASIFLLYYYYSKLILHL